MGKAFTQNGHDLFEVVSALQKTIRRGDEESAMYWALEMIPRFEKYLWRRLIVIANEDVGLANLQLLLLVPSQRDVFFEFRTLGKNGSARLVLANTILAMCRSEKSRLADHFQCHVLQRRLRGYREEIPDYALDKHTLRGKRMGRGVDHWLEEGCELLPAPTIEDPYEESAASLWREGTLDDGWGNPGKRAKSAQLSMF